MHHRHISFIIKWSLGNRGQTLYSKLCISVFNDFFLYNNGLMVTEKLLEHFFMPHSFTTTLHRIFHLTFCSSWNPNWNHRNGGNMPLYSHQMKFLLLSLLTHVHSCLNSKPHRLKMKYKIVCLEKHLPYEVTVAKYFWINKLVTFKWFWIIFLLM